MSSDIPLPFSEEELAETMRMANALHALERDTPVPSVGEAVISAFASARGGFRYNQQAFLAADNEQVIAADEGWVAADLGMAASGGFGYMLLVPVESGIGVIGLHFPHAGLGLLYHPLSRDDPYVYTQVTHADFRRRVHDDHGMAIDGPGG
jgi:hypothetical protein